MIGLNDTWRALAALLAARRALAAPLAARHAFAAALLATRPTVVAKPLDAWRAATLALHCLIDQFAGCLQLARRRVAAPDRGQLALKLLELQLQLAQRLGDLLVHGPSVAAS
jgi:hypothetical protein